ncbi:epimerase [Uliginosibacterium sp. H3]|uniref:Epimerase n=1 Tax=Uliginosibacterium silvisoli TaxID=3114758 RepID=A0ABU6JYI1_9RHOO|nr:epimerase [Uliginosibacterium sp. H3]
MKVILFGASGMVGQAVLRECMNDSGIEKVLSIARSPSGFKHLKFEEKTQPDLSDLSAMEEDLIGYHACFYCLGVSSAGMSEAAYRSITFDLTLAAARPLARLNPGMSFIYISGAGTDSSERGRSMWARVKGATENALLMLPFKAVMFRPGGIIPMHGIQSKTRSYRLLYSLTRPLWGVMLAAFPQSVSTSEQVARAMIAVARQGAPQSIMEVRDINAAAGRAASA